MVFEKESSFTKEAVTIVITTTFDALVIIKTFERSKWRSIEGT